MIDPTTDKLTVGGYASLISPMPVLLNGLTLGRFQATFSVQYDGGASMNFLFDAQGTGARHTLGMQGDGGSVAVSLNGPDGSSISPSSSTVGITTISSSDTVWVRVEASGTTLVVKRIKSSTAPTETALASPTDTFTFTGLTFTGGQFGYSAGYGKVNIDDLTIKSDPDSNGSYDTTELVETFTLDSSGYDAGSNPTYDANGNMTFDGTQVYTYDAWNRLVGVAHGYWDGSMAQAGHNFDIMSYDGVGRLITEAISGQGSGHDVTFQNYYAGNNIIEQKTGGNDGTGPTTKQNVWGLRYVNELVQTATNSNPSADSTCETTYSVTQDANWNVQGIVNSSGTLVERYDYSPYGERQVYVSGGTDDPSLYTPASQGTRVTADGSPAAYGTMDFGFQGMLQGQATGLTVTPNRAMNTTLGIWLQEEPSTFSYVDGLDLYTTFLSNPTTLLDPTGLAAMKITDVVKMICNSLGKYQSHAKEKGCNSLCPEQVLAIMIWESKLDPNAVNAKSGATGLGQTLKSTANDLKRIVDNRLDETFVPDTTGADIYINSGTKTNIGTAKAPIYKYTNPVAGHLTEPQVSSDLTVLDLIDKISKNVGDIAKGINDFGTGGKYAEAVLAGANAIRDNAIKQLKIEKPGQCLTCDQLQAFAARLDKAAGDPKGPIYRPNLNDWYINAVHDLVGGVMTAK